MRPSNSLSVSIVLMLVAWAGGVAAARGQSVHAFGDMEIAYDAARWRPVQESEAAVTMQPVGDNSRWHNPVMVKRVAASGSCADLARNELAGRLYERPIENRVEVAKLPAVRLSARTRCRNATPQGVVICVPHRGKAYLLASHQESCRTGNANLFSGIDPLYEIAAGMTARP